jgi:hypothetical protein|tara:strand:+ start:358 stop:879 length:522 start_codon:yes stop_codon:yes gene_type:complete
MTVVINPIIQSQTIAINSLGLGLSSLPNGATESLMELKYSFAGFSSISSEISYGDLVIFKESVEPTNIYGCTLEKANTSDPTHANKNLMIFVSNMNNTLIVMHKGYVDFPNTTNASLNSWVQGDGLYVSESNISITPPQTSGSWVKSIGFCMPNIENVKRIWFESDSTYFTIG